MKSFKEQLKRLYGPLLPTIDLEGESYLYFGGTAYLGMPHNPGFMSFFLEGLRKYGLNNGSSRGNNVQLGIYEEAECYAAHYFGAEAAMVISSGYLAAQLAVKAFSTHGKQLYAPQAHPALWLKSAPERAGDTFAEWAEHAVSKINNSRQTRWVLISNALNNLHPEVYDFSFLKRIGPEKELILIVDDSHGIGILNGGKGILSLIQAPGNVKVVVVASMAKALGVDAGLILASREIIQQLKQSQEFLGASPPSAAGLYAFMKAGTLYQKALRRLQLNMNYFAAAIPPEDWKFAGNFPVYFSRDADLQEKLFRHKVLVSSFPYPDHQGIPLNRVVMTSEVSIESMDMLLNAIAASGEGL